LVQSKSVVTRIRVVMAYLRPIKNPGFFMSRV